MADSSTTYAQIEFEVNRWVLLLQQGLPRNEGFISRALDAVLYENFVDHRDENRIV